MEQNNKKPTPLQNLGKTINGLWGDIKPENKINTYRIDPSNDIIYRTKNKEDFEQKKLELQQQTLLSKQYIQSGAYVAMDNLANLSWIKAMCREADLMDQMPEIGCALDIFMDESCNINSKGQLINIYSKSERVKNVLEDLFTNRLQINTTLPMISRTMCKYGNDYHLLNIHYENGILGWRQLPVYEIERSDGSYSTSYNNYNAVSTSINGLDNSDGVTFKWLGHNEATPYKNWQVAHFRLLIDSQFIPYGSSILSKSRRSWRMLSMMEDMMLIYRLERSIERRIYKVVVGGMDVADIEAFLQQTATSIKRKPVIDPETGQVDLRRGVLGTDQDIIIPVLSPTDPSPIETLPAAQNITAIDDIEFMQNKMLTGLEVPKSFIGFKEAVGGGKNLALLDIRFARRVNRVQQFLIMEMNKVAMIHLFILGFKDDLTNFTITMNNPSTQAEILKVEELQKKLTVIRDAVSDPGNGIQAMSMKRALKEILKWNEEEIMENLNEIRLEKALAAELTKTSQIISRTGIFDIVDKIYGEYNSEYSEGGDMGGEADGGFGGGGMGSMGDGDFDLEGDGEMSGEEGEVPIEGNSSENVDNNTSQPSSETPMESLMKKNNKVITELKLKNNIKKQKYQDTYFKKYMDYLNTESIKNRKELGYVENVEKSEIKQLKESTKKIDNLIEDINAFINKENN